MATRSAGSPRILLLLGGTWHDFDGFGRAFAGWFPDAEITCDLASLDALEGYDVVAMFTCLTPENEDGSPADQVFTDRHATPLAQWVVRGGGLLALHGATVSALTSPALERLVGGAFVSHPPASDSDETVFPFTVHPMSGEHPISCGVDAFPVRDEFYVERHGSDIAVHMVAIDRGVAHPIVWTRTEGKGRVARFTLGHDARAWSLPAYERIVAQAVAWLSE